MIRECLLSQVTQFEEWKICAESPWRPANDSIRKEMLSYTPNAMCFARMKAEWK